MSRFALVLAASLAAPLAAQSWPGKSRLETEACTPLVGPGAEWLRRAERATGLAALHGPLRFTASESEAQAYQSDRMYPPYINGTTTAEFTFDPASGAERMRELVPGGGKGRDLIRTAASLLAVRDSAVVPAAGAFRYFEPGRALNPLAVLADWRGAAATVIARCGFRDYPRIVLTRGRPDERLYLDLKTAMPVKYERVEPNTLWGQVRAEYVYATWWQAGPALLPMATVRYLDGVEQLRRDLTLPQTAAQSVATEVAAAELAPVPLPAPLPDFRTAPDPSQQETKVDTVRVAPDLFLLKAPAYTHAVTAIGDTVFLFEATTAEWRSRADSTWIAALFPGRRRMVLVVTDLAWPHISGVRFWAARGATIVTHRLSRPFLDLVVRRTWTLAPDALERARATARPRWVTVDSAATLAGGAIRLRSIDGVASEGALMAMIPAAGFLWGSDYIQSATRPSLYAREVMAAAGRAGFTPRLAAAQHLPLTPWTTIVATNPPW